MVSQVRPSAMYLGQYVSAVVEWSIHVQVGQQGGRVQGGWRLKNNSGRIEEEALVMSQSGIG